MLTRSAKLGLVSLCLGVFTASLGCGPSIATAPPLLEPTKTKDAFEGVQCSAIRPPTEPDLMGWDSGSRLNLKQLQESGVVGVHYKAKGCNVELEVLNCVGKGAEYRFSAYSATETKMARSQRDLFTDLPIGAARLGGKVGGGRALRTDYMLAGVLAMPVMKAFPASKLEGDCDRATHVVSKLYLGGFAMASGESQSLEARASIFGIGAGGSQDRTAERLATEGSAEACAKAQREGTREPTCSVPLRIGLTPVEGRAEGSCPTGSSWNGAACVQTPPAVASKAPQGNCPAGMAAIPGGTFKMGERGDTVSVAAYCLDVTEVTVSAYAACVKHGTCSTGGNISPCNWGVAGHDSHPINCVDLGQAATFCNAAGKRLPTEEEWEWAARGGDEGRSYAWGSAEPDFQLCWSGIAKRAGTCAVGSFPNGNGRWGLKDLTGNVWEWTASKYSADDAARVIRGGGWGRIASDMRASSRRSSALFEPSGGATIGFRCAR